MIKVGILTVSDGCFRGEREDISGKEIARIIVEKEWEIIERQIVPDERDAISEAIVKMIDESKADIVVTTGGTGIALRDVTPEATKDVIDRELPGFGEIMRVKSFDITPFAITSRMTAGSRGASLIVNLPGSPKAVKECLDLTLSAIEHSIRLLKGEKLH